MMNNKPDLDREEEIRNKVRVKIEGICFLFVIPLLITQYNMLF
jgi:hypothetical protein